MRDQQFLHQKVSFLWCKLLSTFKFVDYLTSLNPYYSARNSINNMNREDKYTAKKHLREPVHDTFMIYSIVDQQNHKLGLTM